MRYADSPYSTDPYKFGDTERVKELLDPRNKETTLEDFVGVNNSVRPIFNPDIVDPRYGIRSVDGKYDYVMSRNYSGISPNRNVYDFLRDLNPEGEVFEYGGKQLKLSPTVIKAMQTTMPINRDTRFAPNAAYKDIYDEVNANWHKFYEGIPMSDAIHGMRKTNAEIQTGLNSLLQWAVAAKNSPDPNIRARAQSALYAVANTQKSFNTAQPIVNATVKQRVGDIRNKATNFMKNNWWWMLPAGGLMAYGLFSGLRGEQQPQQQSRYAGESWRVQYDGTAAESRFQ